MSVKVISIDLKKMEPIGKTFQIEGDFTDLSVQEKIKNYVNSKVDVVMSDMAVNTTGIKNIDAIYTGEIAGIVGLKDTTTGEDKLLSIVNSKI